MSSLAQSVNTTKSFTLISDSGFIHVLPAPGSLRNKPMLGQHFVARQWVDRCRRNRTDAPLGVSAFAAHMKPFWTMGCPDGSSAHCCHAASSTRLVGISVSSCSLWADGSLEIQQEALLKNWPCAASNSLLLWRIGLCITSLR